jgi:hypothetical protein
VNKNKESKQMADLLERLEIEVDRCGIREVIETLAIVCDQKSEHVAANWQDNQMAKTWNKWARILDKAASNLKLSDPLEPVKKFTCSLCHRQFTGFGNNPEPLKPMDARCCDVCNAGLVIPARIAALYSRTDAGTGRVKPLSDDDWPKN